MKDIHIHFGSDKNFNTLIGAISQYSTLGDLFEHLNKDKLSIDGVVPRDDPPMIVENLIVHTDDYGGIKEWAMLGFSSNILENSRLRIYTMWLNNPPTKLYEDIKKTYGSIIQEHRQQYSELSIEILKQISDNYNNSIIGQPHVVRQILSSLYSLMNPNRMWPVTLLFLGDSGVGKTETAKFINSYFSGKMVRVQFSMQQTGDAYKYIFGAGHEEDS